MPNALARIVIDTHVIDIVSIRDNKTEQSYLSSEWTLRLAVVVLLN